MGREDDEQAEVVSEFKCKYDRSKSTARSLDIIDSCEEPGYDV